MPLKAVVDKLDEIPEVLREEYEEKDGVFVLKPVEGMVLETVATEREKGLRQNRDALLAEKKAADEQLRKYLDAGVNLDEWEKLQKELQEAKEKKLLKDGDVDAVVAERTKALLTENATLREKHAEEVKNLTGERSVLTSRLDALVINSELMRAATAAGVHDKAVDLVLDVARRDTYPKWVRDQETDQPVLVADKDGARVLGVNGDPMTPKEWVKNSVASEYPFILKASSGDGAQHGTGTGGGKSLSKSKMSNTDKIEYLKTHTALELAQLPD